MKIFLKLIVKRIDRRRDFNMVFNPSLDSGAAWGVEKLKRKKLRCVSNGGTAN
jgi:hypothetical protein